MPPNRATRRKAARGAGRAQRPPARGRAPEKRAAPVVEPIPVPTAWQVGYQRDPSSGVGGVVVGVATPIGTLTFWLPPDQALDVGTELRAAGREAQGKPAEEAIEELELRPSGIIVAGRQ